MAEYCAWCNTLLTIDVLAQGEEALLASGQLSKSIMSWVWLSL